MPRRHARNINGAADHRSRVALLLVDVINAMDFPEGSQLVKHATAAARVIERLRQRARAASVPVVYANDNFGRWRSDFRATLQNAQRPEMPGCEIAKLLAPDDDDYFVLKPKHSAFYGSSLDLLLGYLGTEHLVLAGFAGDICVQFTAQDAFLRDLELVVPSDAIASETARKNAAALAFMREHLRARTPRASSIQFQALRRLRSSPSETRR
ncbi:MAG: cysteine hydrolase family protein [Kofleriaceae bacterium]